MVMNCQQVWREISNYVDGEVDAALRAAMDEHIRTCRRCASVLAGTRNLVQLYGDERMLELPAGFSRRLQKRLARGSAVGRRWSSWSAWLVPVAAMALIVGGFELTKSFTLRHFIRSQHADPEYDVPPGLQVVVESGSKLFHAPGCQFIHDPSTERTMTAKEAMQEGYTPCPRCLRKYLKTVLKRGSGIVVADVDDLGSDEAGSKDGDE
jgi:Putative zinc-finger